MNQDELTGQTEAILFAGGEPVSLERIAQVLGVRTPVIEKVVAALQEKYNTPHSGVQLLRLGESAQFCTNPAYIQPVREVLDLKRNAPLPTGDVDCRQPNSPGRQEYTVLRPWLIQDIGSIRMLMNRDSQTFQQWRTTFPHIRKAASGGQ